MISKMVNWIKDRKAQIFLMKCYFPASPYFTFTAMPNHTHGITIDGIRTGVDHSTVVETGHALSLQSEPEESSLKPSLRN